METKKDQIVAELMNQIDKFTEVPDICLDMPQWMKETPATKRGPGRKLGSKNLPNSKDIRIHHVLHVAEDGSPYLTQHEYEVSKPKSFVVMFKLSCGANYIDGFNIPISKRMGNINYLKTKTPTAEGICKHLNNCSGCCLLKTFDVLKSFDEPQPMCILRNEVAKAVESYQGIGSLINK
jgi:hypothetical protein